MPKVKVKGLGGRRQVRAIKPGTSVHLSLTIPQRLKAGIEQAANINGRSINVEAMSRLAGSFERQSLLKDVLTLNYGETAAAELMAFGTILRDAYAADNLAFTARIDRATRDKIQDACRKQLVEMLSEMIRRMEGAK